MSQNGKENELCLAFVKYVFIALEMKALRQN